MAKQTILWTALPNGRVEEGPLEGRLRISIVASPRLTPQAPDEQVLKAFPEWVNWPKTLGYVKFQLTIGSDSVDLEPISMSEPDLWDKLFREDTPVSGFVFKDMSKVNLRSFSVRNVLGTLRKHYKNLAIQSTGTPPTLLPWENAHPVLKGMLSDLGTNLERSFNRFFEDDNKEGIERQLQNRVFGPGSIYSAEAVAPRADDQGNPVRGTMFPLRALPPDWHDLLDGGKSKDLMKRKNMMKQFNSAAEYTFYQADRFYRREPLTKDKIKALQGTQPEENQLRRPKLRNIPQPPKVPDLDFHQIVASFGDYPELLRKLGLVIDCVLPNDSPIEQAINAAPTATGFMWLELSWGNAHDPADDFCPRTAWFFDKRRFTTKPKTSDHERGVLKLQYADDRWIVNEKRSPFDVYQVDVDGAALKTVDFVITAQNLVEKSLTPGADGKVTYTTGNKQPVAALRSGGLGVSYHGRAVAVAQSAASAALKDAEVRAGGAASKKSDLFTEDVLRGYRVDVQAIKDGVELPWHSLCRRCGKYKLIKHNEFIPIADDEGYVKGASSTSSASEDANPDDHYLHETMFKWAGWSLVAQRPGKTLRATTDAASGVQGETPEDVTDEVTTGGNGLSVQFEAVKKSLPRLRFGTTYRFRARIVDLAGNSLAFDDKSLEKDDQVTRPINYWRFEPVDPPVLVHCNRTSEGESLERMVIRSDWNVDPKFYLSAPAFSAAITLPASEDFEYTELNERHVVPPKASQLQCEQHGLFDALFTDANAIKSAYAIAAREAGTLYDENATTSAELITPASVAGRATRTVLPIRLPTPDNPTGDRLAAGQYVIHREKLVYTPYLPDAASGGFALRAMPGHQIPGVTKPMPLGGPSAEIVRAPNEELVLIVAHAKEWPDSTGFRIELWERAAGLTDPPCHEKFPDDGTPKWDEDSRVLTLFLAKGRIARLRYSSYIHKAFINTFGLPAWVETEGEREYLGDMARLGCAWMLTPYRELTLVHATQHPVCAPELKRIKLGVEERSLGDLHASLTFHVRLHGPSTGKFEVEANWKEWVDDLEKKGPELVVSQGALGEIQLSENHKNVFELKDPVDEQEPTDDDTRQKRARGDRHEFGDTKFRLIDYRLRATTRFREYFPPSVYAVRDEVTRLGPVAKGQKMLIGADDDPGAPFLVTSGLCPGIIVPSSAPPDEPRVVYIVPTFKWTDATTTQSLDITRQGNGLRVWLERPWFSSGNGELLGVVIFRDDAHFTDIPKHLVPLVTQWGRDPLWDTVLPKKKTRVADFPARVADEIVSLREFEDHNPTNVRVIGHRVHWDEVRSLWYCDIELDPGQSYMPFVRLALVRYQPNALPQAKISKVVQADFSQVLPRRRASFQRNDAVVSFKLRGMVPSHGPMKCESQDITPGLFPVQSTETGRNKVELVLQTRDPAIDSDLAWSDQQILGSSLVTPKSGRLITPLDTSIFAEPAERVGETATVSSRLGTSIDLSTSLNIPGMVVDPGMGVNLDLFEPPIWQTEVTIPDTGGKPARIAVREYERYYTDRTNIEKLAGKNRIRRVVEERLVFTAFFDV